MTQIWPGCPSVMLAFKSHMASPLCGCSALEGSCSHSCHKLQLHLFEPKKFQLSYSPTNASLLPPPSAFDPASTPTFSSPSAFKSGCSYSSFTLPGAHREHRKDMLPAFSSIVQHHRGLLQMEGTIAWTVLLSP